MSGDWKDRGTSLQTSLTDYFSYRGGVVFDHSYLIGSALLRALTGGSRSLIPYWVGGEARLTARSPG